MQSQSTDDGRMTRSNVNTKLIAPVIHSPKRPKWFRYISGQRLSLLIILLLLMFFAISSYIGSARNHDLLKEANRNRSTLIVSTGQLTDISKQEIVYIQQLLTIVEEQNKALKDAGQQIIVVPPQPGKPYILNPTNGVTTPATPLPTLTPRS